MVASASVREKDDGLGEDLPSGLSKPNNATLSSDPNENLARGNALANNDSARRRVDDAEYPHGFRLAVVTVYSLAISLKT
jgi:hypothetical protein